MLHISAKQATLRSHTSGEVTNFLISSYHFTRAFNSHRFPDDNTSIVCIVIVFPTITVYPFLLLNGVVPNFGDDISAVSS
jgi:hypothetical protein